MELTAASRRRFLRDLPFVLAALGVAACGGGSSSIEILRASIDPALRCPGTEELWPGELATRTSNQYVDRSSKPDQFCLVCENFVPPPTPGTCGTCTTVKGPIHPGGWCQSWTKKRNTGTG